MIKLGEKQELTVVENKEGRILLNDNESIENAIYFTDYDKVENLKIGDKLEVFVYRDSDDDIAATIVEPKIKIGEIGYLRVVSKIKSGAFLDWGLEKDLFLLKRDETEETKKNREYLVGLYINKNNKIHATMDIYKILSGNGPYKKDDTVKGTVYSIKEDMGAFVAVDNKYHGLVPSREVLDNLKVGEEREFRVSSIREDGKLNLSYRKKAYKERLDDSEVIYKIMLDNDGYTNVNDKSSPERIKDEFKMTKRAFKRAVGHLLKEKKIRILAIGMETIEKDRD